MRGFEVKRAQTRNRRLVLVGPKHSGRGLVLKITKINQILISNLFGVILIMIIIFP